MVNFVCIVFEQGDKMLTLWSMENLIVKCNLKASLRNLPLAGLLLSISRIIDIGQYLSLIFLKLLSAEWYRCTKFVIIRYTIDLSAIQCHRVRTFVFVMTSILEGVGGGGIERAWSLLMVILRHRKVHRRQIHCQMAVTKCDLMTQKHSRYRTRSRHSIAHLLTADNLWAFWDMKHTISGKLAIFPTSFLCFVMLYTCFVSFIQ